MKLHTDTKLFKDSVRYTAQLKKIPEIYVEKDYWVTYVLYIIFHHKIGKETIFKGGTALSKCFSLIDLFSEDVDLIVMKSEGEANNQLTKKIKTISDIVSEVLPETEIEGVTQKRGMNRKTVHSYSKEFGGDFGQVRDKIILETTWLGNTDPFLTKKVSSFIYEMMVENNQRSIAEVNELLPFDVFVLDPKRTICEKIMSLVRFSYGKEPVLDLRNKIRHTYDLFQLLSKEDYLVFFDSREFDKMLLKVANDDIVSFKNNNKWLINHPCDALFFKEIESVWGEMRSTYYSSFRSLVYGNFPPDTEILKSLMKIKKRLSLIKWNINFESI